MYQGSKKQQQKAAEAKAFAESSDPVKVFCRIRPLPPKSEKCVKRVDDRTIQLSPPVSSVRNAALKEMQYKFEYAFDEDTSQREVFEDVGLPLVRDLVQGKNGLLFTYGNTSSGKTFTIQGRLDAPGIIPRTVDVLFNTISGVLAPKCTFKPDKMNGFDVQSEMDALLDRQRKDRETEKTFRGRPKGKDLDGDFSARCVEDSTVEGVDKDCLYSVFVSYVEIYNNYAYDLLQLDVVLESGKPATLQLREDSNGRIYVAAATEVEVYSANEALRLLSRGQKSRRIASTQLNADSSRSHAIFNIRLVQAPLDETGSKVVEDQDILQISQFSLIDLAGSERMKRTKNDGDRLREAGNINSSLLTLRKCLDTLRSNQTGENSAEMVPYRESKLTHLFKTYFEGNGKVRMIVCLNPAAEEYDETTHVLRFAESAQEVQVIRSQQVRFDQLGFTPGRRAAADSKKRAKENLELFSEEDTMTQHRTKHTSFGKAFHAHLTFPPITLSHHTDSFTLPALVRFLEERISRHKALYESLKARETDFFNRLRDLIFHNHNVRRENTALRSQLEDRNHHISKMESDLAEHIRVRNILMHHSTLGEQAKLDLMAQLNDREYAIGQEQLKRQKYRSKLKGEAKDTAEHRERNFEKQLQDSRDQLRQKAFEQEGQLRRIRDIAIAGSEASPSTSVTPSTPFQSSTTSSATSASASSQYQPTVHRNYSRSRQVAPSTHHASSTHIQNSTTPFMNPRYGTHGRRSKSQDHCLEHRSKHRVPVGTRLQPQYGLMERRKSVTKVEFSDAKKSHKYILEHQQADAEGNIQTSLYKGNLIPTAGGGRAMIFDDVETLLQQDPNAIGVERKRKMLEEAATLVSEPLSEFYENLRQHPQQSTKKNPSQHLKDRRLYPRLPSRDN